MKTGRFFAVLLLVMASAEFPVIAQPLGEPLIAVRDFPSREVVYVVHSGPSWGLGPVFGRVARFMEENDQPGPMFARYLDDPSAMDSGLLRTEVGFFASGRVSPDARFRHKTIPAHQAATMVFRGSPGHSAAHHERLLDWLTARGHLPTGELVEIYKTPADASGEVELRAPLAADLEKKPNESRERIQTAGRKSVKRSGDVRPAVRSRQASPDDVRRIPVVRDRVPDSMSPRTVPVQPRTADRRADGRGARKGPASKPLIPPELRPPLQRTRRSDPLGFARRQREPARRSSQVPATRYRTFPPLEERKSPPIVRGVIQPAEALLAEESVPRAHAGWFRQVTDRLRVVREVAEAKYRDAGAVDEIVAPYIRRAGTRSSDKDTARKALSPADALLGRKKAEILRELDRVMVAAHIRETDVAGIHARLSDVLKQVDAVLTGEWLPRAARAEAAGGPVGRR